MPLLKGFGAFCTRQEGKLNVLSVSEITVAEETTSESALAFPTSDVGVLSPVATFGASSTTTITLLSEFPDENALDLIFGYTKADIASISYPVYKVVTVPETGPYTVTETGLTADQPVDATAIDVVSPGSVFLTQGDAGTAGGFDVSANTLTFNEAQAGKSVAIYYTKTGALTDARGGSLSATTTALGSVELFFKYSLGISQVKNRWYPKLDKSGAPSFGSGADSVEMAFIAALNPGFNFTYLEWGPQA